MLDSGSIDHQDVTARFELEQEDWKALHHRLRSIAKRRVALEAEEAAYLIEAEETHLYRRLGYTTIVEYMERELGYGPHAAKERLRVAYALIELPLTAELFAAGELCFSAVRELTRVVTPATEQAFLANAQGKTAYQVQQMVAGLERGDEPDATPDPRLIRKRVFMDLSAESYAKWRALRSVLEGERGGERMSDDDVVDLLCRAQSGPTTTDDVVPRPAVQTAVTTCKTCKQSFVEAAGEALPIDAATAARLTCDAEHIGDLDSDERTRVTSDIPESIRRKVFHRDHFACTVPGCRATKYLEIHHVRPRELGGDHSVRNLTLCCFGCHQRHHEGALLIAGDAPDKLQFTWRHDDDVESAMTGPSWDWGDGDDADDADDNGRCGAPAR